MEVKEFICEDGSIPYREWFDSLDPAWKAKVEPAVARIEGGNLSSIEWFEGIGERKIDWGPGIRIYLLQDGDDLIVLLGGGSKKRQNKDINAAKELAEQYWAEKKRMRKQR